MRRLLVFTLLAVSACGSEESSGRAGTGGTPSGGGAGGAGGSSSGGAGTAGVAGSAGAVGGSAGQAAVPAIAFASPKDGATVPNPVTFEIAAQNVDEVEIFADETYSLGPAWDPSQKSTLRYRFAGTGVPRPLHVTGRVAGKDVVRADITLTIQPDSCEDQFFLYHFAKNNVAPSGLDLFDPREDALAAIHAEVEKLGACGAGVTLGNMMALILFEGAFRVGAFNTLCEENSYNKTTTGCDAAPEALYSYQFGLGAIHTSNFHPCKGGAWTQKMRSMLLAGINQAGFPSDPSVVTATEKAKLAEFCPGASPSAVDHYLLGAHDPFGIPKDASGNHLQGFGKFPLFDPEISLALSLYPIEAACSTVQDDRDAIAVWGGGDASYSTTAKQDQIMASWKSFQASCK